MDAFETDLERELTVEFPRKVQEVDAVAAKIAEHRAAIDSASRSIMTIERQRDLTVRGFESQLEQAEFVYANAVSHFTREIEKAKSSAESQITVQRQLQQSAQAALRPLENVAIQDEDAAKRQVPRSVTGLRQR